MHTLTNIQYYAHTHSQIIPKKAPIRELWYQFSISVQVEKKNSKKCTDRGTFFYLKNMYQYIKKIHVHSQNTHKSTPVIAKKNVGTLFSVHF